MSNAAAKWTYAAPESYAVGRSVKVPNGRISVVASPPEPTTGRVYVSNIGWYHTSQLRVRA